MTDVQDACTTLRADVAKPMRLEVLKPLRAIAYWAVVIPLLILFSPFLLLWKRKFYNQNPFEHDPYGRFGE